METCGDWAERGGRGLVVSGVRVCRVLCCINCNLWHRLLVHGWRGWGWNVRWLDLGVCKQVLELGLMRLCRLLFNLLLLLLLLLLVLLLLLHLQLELVC